MLRDKEIMAAIGEQYTLSDSYLSKVFDSERFTYDDGKELDIEEEYHLEDFFFD